MSNRFKLLVFDWDGTLMDSQARIIESFQSAIADNNFAFRSAAQIRHIIGLGLDEGIAGLFPDVSPVQRMQLASRYSHYFYHASGLATPLFSGVDTMLRQLHASHYRLAVATGKSRKGLNQVLLDTKLEHLFCSSRCAEESVSKPHPHMLQEIMQEVDITPEETLMIGDSEYDLQMANNAGVASVAVSYGVHEKARLLACNPMVCLDDLRELPRWLQKF